MIGANPYEVSGFHVLKVETHLHTLHSDGRDDVLAMFDACREAGYDAVALTDHNTLSGIPEAIDAADRLGLILLPGVEVTTFRGHAVALGVQSVPEWRDLETRGMPALAEDVHEQGGVICIAHPAALGSPVCSGCAWDWPVEPDSVDLLEIFSAPRPNVGVALARWRRFLEDGGRAAPAAAGDVHSVAAAARPRAATYVYAADRSTAAALDALRAGQVFVSARRRLDFWLEDDHGNVALVGQRVAPGHWTPRTVPTATVRELNVAGLGGRCVYAELSGAGARVEAVSAPIWIDNSQ